MNHNLKTLYKVCIDNGYIAPDIDYKTFSILIREFHKEISQRVLRGYKFRPGENLGQFHLVKDIRRGKTIDWGNSNKLKQSIIERGGVPYDKVNAPDGEEWLLYYQDNDYYKWKWFKETSTTFIKNVKYYIFKPCTTNRRSIAKVIKEDDLITESYGTYK